MQRITLSTCRPVFLLLIFLFVTLSLFSQERAVLEVATRFNPEGETPALAVPLSGVSPFLAYAVVWEEPAGAVGIRFSAEGASGWTDWEKVETDPHVGREGSRRVGKLSFADQEMRFFQVRYQGEMPPSLTVHFYSPGPSKSLEEAPSGSLEKNLTCPCPIPGFSDRLTWCPDGNCPPHPNPTPTTVTHLIVHHSAGPNTSSDWAAVVRSFWDYHVNTNGWSDIGYNWLVDPEGRVYLGRGDDVIGAHFCGANSNTMGVCVIGDFTSITPTPEAITSLTRLLVWKACDAVIDPLGFTFHPPSGSTLANISGHRDGCATACPGNQFYPMLPAVRQGVADYINTSCSGLPGPTGLQAQATGATEVELSWVDNTGDETAFLLERSQDFDDSFAFLAALPENTVAYIDVDLAPGTTYFYRIRAALDADTSDYSNIAEVTTLASSQYETGAWSGVQLFPNPSSGQSLLRIDNELMGRIGLEITAVDGRRLRSWSVRKETRRHQEQISLAGLPPGLYFLKLQHRRGNAVLRLARE